MLTIIPMMLTEAKSFVEQYHRHHKPPIGGLFAIGAAVGEKVVGVAIVGRPVARMLQDGYTCEVGSVLIWIFGNGLTRADINVLDESDLGMDNDGGCNGGIR